MAETFFLRLAGTGAATWGTFDATGALVGTIGRGTPEAARVALGSRRCAVLVDALDVLVTEASLPATSQSRLRQMLPFSLEESLASDVDEMVFAIGPRLPSGATQVTAVDRERMESWIGQLRAAGIAPTALYSAIDGVPDIPATLVIVIEGSRIAGRKPGRAPFVFDGLELTQVLSFVSAGKPDEPELRHIRVFTDAAGHERFGDELRQLDLRYASAEVKLLPEGVFPHLAATLAQRSGTNLLQGAYAPKSNWGNVVRPWRLAASLAGAILVLGLVLEGAEYSQLRRADGALADLIASNCQRVVGESSASACEREVRQRLGSSAGTAGEDFLSTLAAIASVRGAQMRIDALSYRNRTMDLQLVAPNVPALDDFSRELEQTRRFSVDIEAANQRDTGTEGRLRIVGANP